MISKIFFKIESMLFSVFFGTIDIFPRDLRFFEGGRQIFVFFVCLQICRSTLRVYVFRL